MLAVVCNTFNESVAQGLCRLPAGDPLDLGGVRVEITRLLRGALRREGREFPWPILSPLTDRSRSGLISSTFEKAETLTRPPLAH
jgi:hypothetical protein